MAARASVKTDGGILTVVDTGEEIRVEERDETGAFVGIVTRLALNGGSGERGYLIGWMSNWEELPRLTAAGITREVCLGPATYNHVDVYLNY